MRRIRDAVTGELVTTQRKITATETATQRALSLAKGSPPEWDGKPVTTFPGAKRKPLPGQLDIAS